MMDASHAAERPLRVVVSGGSIAGLGTGLALHRAGIDVHVFEQDGGAMRSAGAGLVVQPELAALFRPADGATLPTTRCRGRQTLGFDGEFGPLQRMPQQFTSWTAVHATLLQIFPGERYHRGATVERFTRNEHALQVDIVGVGAVTADLLVAADGAQSPLRRTLLPEVQPHYAGYVAWRGTVPERDMPQDILDAFDDVFTFADARSGGHALAYFIPGESLETAPGARQMNWVWYVGANAAARDDLLVTRDGVQRRASLRRGMARQSVVADLKARAVAELHPMFARLIAQTAEPFLQTIVDFAAPRTVFGRTVLVGDAAFIVRPHTAGGAAKAARDAQLLAEALRAPRSEIDRSLDRFQREQLHYGQSLLAYGVQLGRRWARLGPD
ncbi:FAD-dependent monooxygenase [Sphingomonas sp. ABOLE]|uniref:FAD binding domain-containing protein n=1 Tax=Sphingomonas sp. ABOLE TaxID=1985878 RepID=UPI000F7F168E|nr:FAD-dependent monooxygenase [Sphingomonas sp. ABOLE]RSV39733.1 FAD-dependent monooxygenase [Sphingomonas sp. ABOLE]